MGDHMPSQKLAHGGRLIAASREYGIPLEQWIDLSTGISPVSWPVPPLPAAVWRDLPQQEDRLLEQAARYYGCRADCLLPVPGSQFAIENIPRLMPPGKVAVPFWGYHEHAHQWQRSGHQLVCYQTEQQLLEMAAQVDVRYAVVINPNNPSGEIISPDLLRQVAVQLAEKEGCLLVDEAFNDYCEGQSLCSDFAARPVAGLIVLRSVGKFFGLAGIRLGFVVADPVLLARLEGKMSPWAVNHPARWVGCEALSDRVWQQNQRKWLRQYSRDWSDLLMKVFANIDGLKWCSSSLFVSVEAARKHCRNIYRFAAEQGLLLRYIEPYIADGGIDTAVVRFGLPAPACLPPVKERLVNVAVAANGALELNLNNL